MFLVLDSNVWIYAATADEFPVEIYSDILGERLSFFEGFLSGTYETAITPYMLLEIKHGLYRSQRVSGTDVDRVLEKLFELIWTCDSIRADFPAEAVRETTLEDVRGGSTVRLLSHLLGIQKKDVPIFLLAYEYRYERPHILTDDSDFAELSPAEFDLPAISLEDVNLTW